MKGAGPKMVPGLASVVRTPGVDAQKMALADGGKVKKGKRKAKGYADGGKAKGRC